MRRWILRLTRGKESARSDDEVGEEKEWTDVEGGEQVPITPTMSPRGGSWKEETNKGLSQDQPEVMQP